MARKQLPAGCALARSTDANYSDGTTVNQVLRSCRLQYLNPATFEVTAVYVTRTDANRYRAKIFRGGKCLLAQYVEGDDFLDILRKVSVNVVNL